MSERSFRTAPTAAAAIVPPSPGRFRWVIVGLLFLITVVNYMDRQVLGLLKPDYLQKQFHWSELDFGRINIAFQASYAIGQAAFGPFIDWAGTRSAYAVAVVFWSLAAMAHALTRTVLGFGGARFALGLGESGNFPVAIRTLTEWFPARERSLAVGIFNTSTNLGGMFAPLLVPWLAWNFGWRGTFVALGLAGLAWLALWYLYYASPERSARIGAAERAHIIGDAERARQVKIPWRRLLRYREAWAYYGTCVLVGPVWWFYGFWLPDFFSKQFHLDLMHFGPPLVVVYAAAGLGSVAGGWLSSALLARGWPLNRARKAALLVCACCTLPVILSTQVGSVWLATLFFALAAAAHQGWSATMYATVADLFPQRAVASVVGFGGMLASVVSMGFFWLVSTILQGEGTYVVIMRICGSAYVAAWLIFQLAAPRIRPVALDPAP